MCCVEYKYYNLYNRSPGSKKAPPNSLIEADLPTRSSAASPGSGVEHAGVATSAASSSPPQHQHATRLQQGISKPKTYTDGTVCWCMLSRSSAEEPSTVDDALRDKNWVFCNGCRTSGVDPQQYLALGSSS